MPIDENQANKGKTKFSLRSANKRKKSSTGREDKLLCFWSYTERFRHMHEVSSKIFGPRGSKVNKY